MKVPGHPTECPCWRCKPPMSGWSEPAAKSDQELRREQRGRMWVTGSVAHAPVERRDEWWRTPALRVAAGMLGGLLLLATGNVVLLGAAFLVLVIAAGVRLGSHR